MLPSDIRSEVLDRRACWVCTQFETLILKVDGDKKKGRRVIMMVVIFFLEKKFGI